MTWEVNALFKLFITRIAAVALISLTENALNSVDYSEEVIDFMSNLPLDLFLHYFTIDDL